MKDKETHGEQDKVTHTTLGAPSLHLTEVSQRYDVGVLVPGFTDGETETQGLRTGNKAPELPS